MRLRREADAESILLGGRGRRPIGEGRARMAERSEDIGVMHFHPCGVSVAARAPARCQMAGKGISRGVWVLGCGRDEKKDWETQSRDLARLNDWTEIEPHV
jgi:hypothetical protein